MMPHVSSAVYRIDLQFQSIGELVVVEQTIHCILSSTENGKAQNIFFTWHDQEKKKTEFIQNETPSFEGFRVDGCNSSR